MSSYVSNAANQNFLDQKNLEQAADEKALTIREAIKSNHYQTYLSQKAGRAGENTTGAGRMLRGVMNRNNSDEDAYFFGNDLSFAMIMLSQPLINAWSGATQLFKNAFNNFTASTALSTNSYPVAYQRNTSLTQTEYASDAFLAVVNSYEAEQVETAQISAESAFNAIDKGFKIPLRAHITQAYNDAQGNEDIAKHNLRTVILEQNGICFSTELDKHIICATKLNELRTEFSAAPETRHLSDLGSNPIAVFKQATQTYTPKLQQQAEASLKRIQPALVPVNT